VIDARHEAGAGFMAEGWSLATSEPGVVIVTGGPGLTNVLTPIADASSAGVPLVVVTGAIRRSERGRGFPQDVDHLAAAEPFTVWSDVVASAEAIPADVAEAFWQARTRRGPVLLEVPLDVQLAEVQEPGDVEPRPEPRRDRPSRGDVSRAAAVLHAAERPLAIVGEGAYWSGAGAALRRFAETCGVPVFTVRAARGLLPDDHELAFGQPNFLGWLGQHAFPLADALIVVGCELDIVLAFGGIAPQAQLVRIDSDVERAHRHRRPDVAVIADEAAALEALTDAVGEREADAWVEELRVAAIGPEAPPPDTADRAAPPHSPRLIEAVARVAGAPASFAVDAGELALWAIAGLPATGPGRLLTSFATPLATLGNGIPFAIAAKLARPDEPAVAVVGDGAFGLSAMELDTAVRHGIGIAVVIGNDAAWGIVKRQAEMGFGRSVAAVLAGARYDRMAEGLGARGIRVAALDGLDAGLASAFGGAGPVVVDVAVDPAPGHPAMPFIAAMFAPPA
jgi:thiamine pyrophosphate-dependent acetolactate synthase large subunit-like protein